MPKTKVLNYLIYLPKRFTNSTKTINDFVSENVKIKIIYFIYLV